MPWKNQAHRTDSLDLSKFHTRILCYVYGIFSCIHTVGKLPAFINNIDTARTGSSEVILSNQVMKCYDSPYANLASFSQELLLLSSYGCTPLNAIIIGPGWLRNRRDAGILEAHREDNQTDAGPPVYISYTVTVVNVRLSVDGVLYECEITTRSKEAKLNVVGKYVCKL